eukprot:gene13314-17837_t
MESTQNFQSCLPNFISRDWVQNEQIFVPILVDITCDGISFVDRFCWNLCNEYYNAQELAVITCKDYNLPFSCIDMIANQLQEQIDAYSEFIKLLIIQGSAPNYQSNKSFEKFVIEIDIIYSNIKYVDNIIWDPLSDLTPEKFAHKTRQDLGLPMEMEIQISYVIREHLFRWLISSFAPTLVNAFPVAASTQDTKPGNIIVTLVPLHEKMQMMANNIKSSKPNGIEDYHGQVTSFLPSNLKSNHKS